MDIFERLLLQAAVVKRLKELTDATRAKAAESLEPGDMKRPRGLGSVSLSEASPTAKVVDREAFEEHLKGCDGAVSDLEITATREELLAVLATHAPSMLENVWHFPEWMVKGQLDKAAAGEDVPGVEVVMSEPRLVVRTKPAALAEADELLAGTPLQIEGVK